MKLLSYSSALFILTSGFLHATPSDLEKNLVVNFVTEANYYPFEYLNEQQDIQGFDIDIANAVCHVANLTCHFHNQNFDSLLLTLQFSRFDAVIAALDITKERSEKVDFSDSYYKTPPVFVSRLDAPVPFSIKGKFIGVQSESSNHHYLIKHAKNNSFIISYFSSSEAFSDLSSNKIDLVFADKAVVDDFLSHNNNELAFSIQRTENIFLDNFSSGYGIAVKKGNSELLGRINYGLKVIKNDGTYVEIYNRYFIN